MIAITSIDRLAQAFGWTHVRTVVCDESTGHFYRRFGANFACMSDWTGTVVSAVTVDPDGTTAITDDDAPRLPGGIDPVAGAVQTFILRHAAPVSLVKNDTRPAWLRWVQSEG